MERVIEETIAAMAARLESEYQDALAARLREVAQSGKSARRDLIQRLNQSVRRLRHPENASHWAHTLVDATRGFCDRAALFLVRDRRLHLEASRNLEALRDIDASRNIDGPPPAEATQIDDAPAFASAIDTRDTLVALRTRGELSGSLADLLGDTGEKCWIIPVIARHGVDAVLYADSGDVDVDALELLAGLAGSIVEPPPAALAQPEPLISIAPAPKPEILSWFSLSREDRELHLRAQRFARVQVAQIRLYQSEKVKNGRAAHDLYTSLKEEVDAAREAYRREVLNASDSMVDYLHLELVRTLANDDVEVLGQDYPGPMV
jgi:hypothetical protein